MIVIYNERGIVIGGIARAGTDSSANDEWIELFNNTGNDIAFDSNRVLDTEDGWIAVPAGKLLLPERTDFDHFADVSKMVVRILTCIFTGNFRFSMSSLKLCYCVYLQIAGEPVFYAVLFVRLH